MSNTKIEWATKTWNPVTGCTKVSAGCANCYAERQFPRTAAGQTVVAEASRNVADDPRAYLRPRRFTDVRCHPERLRQPLSWRKPQRVFVASMSDPFHDAVPDEFLDSMLAVIALAPQHHYQLLTKRPQRMRDYIRDPETAFRVQRAMDAIAVNEDMRGHRERWSTIKGFPGYSVSSLGRVRSSLGAGAKILAQADHPNGYRQVTLRSAGQSYAKLVHALVLGTFVRCRQDGEEVRHRNGDKADNRIANLSWGTKAENMQDAVRHGSARRTHRGTLTADVVEDIRVRRRAGALLDTLAKDYGLTKQQVSAVARGKLYRAAELAWPLPQLWLGVSAEDQATADERIPVLLQTPAAVRFVSAEPLLAALDLDPWLCPFCRGSRWTNDENWEPEQPWDGSRHPADGLIPCGHCNQGGWDVEVGERAALLDWAIVGGESGPKARPCNAAWIRSIVEQCRAAEVPVFVKQLGADVRDRNDAGFMADWNDGTGWPAEPDDVVDDPDGVGDRGYQGAPVRVRLRHPKGGRPRRVARGSPRPRIPRECRGITGVGPRDRPCSRAGPPRPRVALPGV